MRGVLRGLFPFTSDTESAFPTPSFCRSAGVAHDPTPLAALPVPAGGAPCRQGRPGSGPGRAVPGAAARPLPAAARCEAEAAARPFPPVPLIEVPAGGGPGPPCTMPAPRGLPQSARGAEGRSLCSDTGRPHADARAEGRSAERGAAPRRPRRGCLPAAAEEEGRCHGNRGDGDRGPLRGSVGEVAAARCGGDVAAVGRQPRCSLCGQVGQKMKRREASAFHRPAVPCPALHHGTLVLPAASSGPHRLV